ncbi:hypothetical protein K469DRAFT_144977 [Zopfia rhizophila CBS 207.26]|uniref:Zn(2)-C6 fungal-type domain-containing protein n=1 Tax=Zopfia rhizophila CBS 207.26 TaxID=1314779 RepID=A0A6A6E6I0_9PEZI|nr:hypothetical protein K469DRAFT_144977 [Zopfia rhizophila CBS 207.26]
MVYCGRPSTGCQKCRQRKIKCDELAGGCLRCSERGYQCPGYENQLDRCFRDESAHVKQKAIKAKEKAIALRDERRMKAKYRSPANSNTPIEYSVVPSLDEQGITFFMLNFACGLDQPPLESDLYHQHLSTHGFHPIVAASMTALGLAGISNISKDATLKREFTRSYLKALHMTNAALACPTEVRNDSTLLATMLLSIFEAVTGSSNERSLSAWSNHVDGSALLLQLRGMGQFSSLIGRRMFMQNVSHIIMNSMGRDEPVPAFVHEMSRVVIELGDPKDPGFRFYDIHVKAIDFRAQIIHRQISDLNAILNKALELDRRAEAIFSGTEPAWNYEVIHSNPRHVGVFGDHYHIYPSFTAAQTWNWTRTVRIYFNDIIRNSLLIGLSMSPPVFAGSKYISLLDTATQTLCRMQSDILASVPQYLLDTPNTSCDLTSTRCPCQGTPGTEPPKFLWTNFRDQKLSGFRAPGASTSRLPLIRMSGGVSFPWAVYIAGATSVATPEVHGYAIKSLHRMKDEMGVNQAMVLALALQQKIHLDRAGEQPFEIVPRYLPRKGEHVE